MAGVSIDVQIYRLKTGDKGKVIWLNVPVQEGN